MSNKFDRFDFEQALISVWTSVDDLQHVLDAIDNNASDDEVQNLIIGIRALMNAKCTKAFAMFEEGVSSRNIV